MSFTSSVQKNWLAMAILFIGIVESGIQLFGPDRTPDYVEMIVGMLCLVSLPTGIWYGGYLYNEDRRREMVGIMFALLVVVYAIVLALLPI